MKLHVTGGTNLQDLVLFWPELLPADFDHLPGEEADTTIERLRDAGQLIWLPTTKSGEFHLGLFVGDPVPELLASFCQLTTKVEALDVPGEGWFGGMEFLFREDRFLLDRYPRLCTAIAIPPGRYSAEVFRTEIPDDVYEFWLRDQAGAAAQRWWWLQTWIASLGVVALLVLVGCLFFGTRQLVYSSLVVAAVLLCIAWLMSCTAGYQRIQKARQEYCQAYPDYVVRLRTQL